MDPSPKSLPILSYVMSKISNVTPIRSAAPTKVMEFDIERPPPPTSCKEPYFELTERMPHLKDPKVIAEMREAVADAAQTRSVLKALGERPDHESVDLAKAKLAEIDSNPSLDAAAKQIEKQAYTAVLSLDQMHASYAEMLNDAEVRLQKIYDKAVSSCVGNASLPYAEQDNPTPSTGNEVVDEEVIRILQEVTGSEVERINLSGRYLRFFPEAFGQLRTLREFDLSSNQLEFIPDAIGGLVNLEELNLSSNILESLPDSIGLFLNLKILNVSGNKLTSLPDNICCCRSLVELDAGFNKLTYLPTNIGYGLLNLKRLLIPLNKIRSLPTSIGDMISLLILDVHFNELRGLPTSIGRLRNLEILNLSKNFSDLTKLPETICDLINLKELDISNNQIHELPNTFGRLQSLSKINVDENPLVVPPKEVLKDGVEAVKVFMSMRWLDMLAEEEQRSELEENNQAQAGLLTRSASWLGSMVSSVTGYLGMTGQSDPYLNRQL